MDTELLETAFRIMLDNSTDIIFLKDKNLIYRAVSEPFVKMAGKGSENEIIGLTDADVFTDEQLAKRYIMDDKKILKNGKDLLHYMEPLADEDGQPRYGSTSKYLLRSGSGEIMGILGIIKDVTKDYMARQHYQQELKYLFNLPKDTYAVCYIDVNDWRVIKQRRQQIENGTLQAGQTVEEICEYAVKSIVDQNDAAVEFYKTFTPAKLRGIYASGRNSLTFEYEREMSDGSTKWVHNEVHLLTDADNGHLCVMLSAKDIDDDKREEQKIINAAKLDRMTKILNRETAMDYIRQILKHENNQLHALLMLDIDNFKTLNDTLGHQAGDEFLINLADKLKHSFRDSDVVGRIGGDEFFVFLRNVTEVRLIEEKAREMLKIVADCAGDYPQVRLGGSIGISLYPGNGNTLDMLYAKADEALYKAKASGKNQFVFAE